MAVDQDQHFAFEITALAFGGAAADVDRGLARGPLAHETDGVFRQQLGDGLGVGVRDAVLRDHLHGAGDLGDLLGIAGRRNDDLRHEGRLVRRCRRWLRRCRGWLYLRRRWLYLRRRWLYLRRRWLRLRRQRRRLRRLL